MEVRWACPVTPLMLIYRGSRGYIQIYGTKVRDIVSQNSTPRISRKPSILVWSLGCMFFALRILKNNNRCVYWLSIRSALSSTLVVILSMAFFYPCNCISCLAAWTVTESSKFYLWFWQDILAIESRCKEWACGQCSICAFTCLHHLCTILWNVKAPS